MIYVNFCGPLRLLLRCFLPGPRAVWWERLMSPEGLPRWDHIMPFAVRIRPLRHWKRFLLPVNRDASHRSKGSFTSAETGYSFIIHDRTVRSVSGQQGGSAFVITAQF